MKRIFLILLWFLISIPAYSYHLYYVNGAIGNDTLPDAGNSSKNPLATIQNAVNFASSGDEIIVEGLHNNASIIYYENVVVSSKKSGLKFTGSNNPIIDGDNFQLIDSIRKKMKKSKKAEIQHVSDSIRLSLKNGFYLISSSITIKGFTIRNFTDRDTLINLPKPNKQKLIKDSINKDLKLKHELTLYELQEFHSCGIYGSALSINNIIEDNIIENCNYGIFLDGPVKCEINGNKISDIPKFKDDLFTNESIKRISRYSGGVGILLYPNGIAIDGNLIGSKKGNSIINAENIGLCIGSESITKNAEQSKVNQNTFDKCGIGFCPMNINGIVEVTFNTFKDNYISVSILGFPIDTWIGDNTFLGAVSETEIMAEEVYDSAFFYDLCFANENVFTKYIHAAVNVNSESIAVEGKRYARTSKEKAEEDAGGVHIVKSFTQRGR
ncbi:MAG: Beta helix protein [Ignavibacteria bacterium]|nr:Beta helix protein [Ignavibacteria bacterium]